MAAVLAAALLGGSPALAADGPGEGPVRSPVAPSLHTRLESSLPAADDTLRGPPAELRLTFSQAVEADLADVSVLRTGNAALALEMEPDPADRATLVAPLPRLAPGAYRVTWSIISADGHRVQGSFVFHVAGATGGTEGGAPAGATPPPPPTPETAPPPASGETAGAPLALSLLRGTADYALAAFAGLLLFLAWPGGGSTSATRRLAAVAAVAAPALLVAHAAAWAAHSTNAGTPLSGRLTLFSDTLPGQIEAARLALALLAAWALLLVRRHGLALLFGGAAVVAGAALGHSAVVAPAWSVPAKAVHLVAISAWLGGLLALATASREAPAFRDEALRVSSVALAAVVTVTLTGVLQALLLVPATPDVLFTEYGRLILLKVGGLMVLVGFGWFNRSRLLPALPAENAGGALRRSVRLEALVLLLVAIAAGVLANVPPPSDGAGGEAGTGGAAPAAGEPAP